MRRIKLQIAIVLSFAFILSLQAQDQRTDQFLNRLQEFGAKTESIASDFDQEQEFAFLDETMTAKGRFYFMKPGIMKWEQNEPEAYAFVIKSEEAYKIENGQKKKIPLNSPQIVGFKKFLLTTMDGSILESDEFSSEISFTGQQVSIEMIPEKKAAQRMFEKVVLKFDEQSLLLQELIFFETETDFRRIRFSNHQLNQLKEIK